MAKWIMLFWIICVFASCAAEVRVPTRPSADPSLALAPSEQPWPSSTQMTPSPTDSTTPLPTSTPTPTLSSYPIEVVAGSGQQGFTDGPALQASFNSPKKPCFDPRDGSMYIPDTHMLRKLTPEGQVIRVAGGIDPGYANRMGQSAQFNLLFSCVVNQEGDVFLADYYNRRVRKYTPPNSVTTFLGTGEARSVDGDRTQASFESILDLLLSPQGELYITDLFRIRRFHAQQVTTVNGAQTYAGDRHYPHGELTLDSPIRLGRFLWLAQDEKDNLYISDEDTSRIRKRSATGKVETISYGYYEFFEYNKTVGLEDQFYHWFQFPRGIAYDHKRKKIYVLGSNRIYESSTEDKTIQYHLIAGALQNDKTHPQDFGMIEDGSLVMGPDHHLYMVDATHHKILRLRLPN